MFTREKTQYHFVVILYGYVWRRNRRAYKRVTHHCLPSQDKYSGRIKKNDGGITADNNQRHIPFAVIVAATDGDEAAIQKILKFYDGYISKLSLHQLYDEYENVYMVVGSELKGRIQAAVMDMIANF